ncbi:MAG TPA: glycosyltransferase family 9 protein [Pyrinomonadaceae bacterium]|nr:glycosyltransferase family 9 protein [Pyrinomonadaceae bacterium]
MKNNAIDWLKVKRVLIVRLRSIGDTVLSTPSLIALRRFLPDAQIDVLLEDWVAPVLQGFEAIDNVLTVEKTSQSRFKTAWQIRRNKYDVAFNLHGGTTATFFVRASGARHRVGFENYQYSFLYNHLLSSSSDFWQQEKTHSAEQQLALLGSVGVPVEDKPKSKLTIVESSAVRGSKLPFALIHPVAAFPTKQWSTENFAEIAEFLVQRGMQIVAVGTKKEREVFDKLRQISQVPIQCYDNLTLPQITNLASRAKIFVGNDSGIAHMAAAVNTPSVVIFGSSNRAHWSPWTDAPHEIVFEKFDCQPCPGYVCEEFGEPKCILSVKVESVKDAIEKVLESKK